MHLSIEREECSFGTRHWLRVRKSIKPDLDIFFDFLDETNVPSPQFMDGHLQAVLHRAMAAGESIHVNGAITGTALFNLGEYQDAMHAFYPDIYCRVPITADEIVDFSDRSRSRAISVFSGGVDATFGLLRHKRALTDNAALPIQAAVIIQHLDLDNPDAFMRLVEMVRPTCKYVGVPLRVTRTNLRQVIGQGYLYTYGTQLGSALQNFADHYDYGVINSSEPYISLLLPLGSSPVTDHLLSGGAMQIIHDGAGFTRTEKVELLAKHPEVLKSLHVCLKHPYENCGVCSKCLRTQMNFLAVGVTRLPCMPGPLRLELIDELEIPDVHVPDLRTLVDYARKHGVEGEWPERLERRLDTYQPPTPAEVRSRERARQVQKMLKFVPRLVRKRVKIHERVATANPRYNEQK